MKCESYTCYDMLSKDENIAQITTDSAKHVRLHICTSYNKLKRHTI